jgi:toluene monooxygenase system protein B
MAAFPITGRFVGDFVPHLVAVDTEDTMDEVAQKVAGFSVGHRIAQPTGDPGYEVLLDGEVLPASQLFGTILSERQLLPLQWIDVRFREADRA